MKAAVKFFIFAGVLGMAAGCGNSKSGNQTAEQTEPERIQAVSVMQTTSKDVPQEEIYTYRRSLHCHYLPLRLYRSAD